MTLPAQYDADKDNVKLALFPKQLHQHDIIQLKKVKQYSNFKFLYSLYWHLRFDLDLLWCKNRQRTVSMKDEKVLDLLYSQQGRSLVKTNREVFYYNDAVFFPSSSKTARPHSIDWALRSAAVEPQHCNALHLQNRVQSIKTGLGINAMQKHAYLHTCFNAVRHKLHWSLISSLISKNWSKKVHLKCTDLCVGLGTGAVSLTFTGVHISS